MHKISEAKPIEVHDDQTPARPPALESHPASGMPSGSAHPSGEDTVDRFTGAAGPADLTPQRPPTEEVLARAQTLLDTFKARKPGPMQKLERDSLMRSKEAVLLQLDALKKQIPSSDLKRADLDAMRDRISNIEIAPDAAQQVRMAQSRFGLELAFDQIKGRGLSSADLEQIAVDAPELYADGLQRRRDFFADQASLKQGIEPVKRFNFQMNDEKTLRSALLELAKERNILGVTVPKHAMLAITDPQNSSYRFFDPNLGVLHFDDATTFASAATQIMAMYVPGVSRQTGSGSLDLSDYLEVPIDQTKMAKDAVLQEGVCKALSDQVAHFFAHNPDFRGQLTANTLDLDSFARRDKIALSESNKKMNVSFNDGKKYLAAGDFIEARLAFKQALLDSAKSLPQPLEDELFDFIEHGDYDAALSKVQEALAQKPGDRLLAVYEGYLASRIKLNELFQPAARVSEKPLFQEEDTPLSQSIAALTVSGSEPQGAFIQQDEDKEPASLPQMRQTLISALRSLQNPTRANLEGAQSVMKSIIDDAGVILGRDAKNTPEMVTRVQDLLVERKYDAAIDLAKRLSQDGEPKSNAVYLKALAERAAAKLSLVSLTTYRKAQT